MLNNKKYEIWKTNGLSEKIITSVKRKRDDKIFDLGDLVNLNYAEEDYPIIKFTEYTNDIVVHFERKKSNPCYNTILLDNLVVLKKSTPELKPIIFPNIKETKEITTYISEDNRSLYSNGVCWRIVEDSKVEQIPVLQILDKQLNPSNFYSCKKAALDSLKTFFILSMQKNESTITTSDEKFFNDRNYHIETIHRIKDNKVFSIGNESRQGEIISFKKVNNGLDLVVNTNKNINIPLNSLSIDDYVFTTEDGVCIFIGDKYYFLTKFGHILNIRASFNILEDTKNNPLFKRFSTEESAKLYLKKREKSKILFTTNDGVNIRANQEYYLVLLNINHVTKLIAQGDRLYDSSSTRFGNYENAKKYVEKLNKSLVTVKEKSFTVNQLENLITGPQMRANALLKVLKENGK